MSPTPIAHSLIAIHNDIRHDYESFFPMAPMSQGRSVHVVRHGGGMGLGRPRWIGMSR
jgi:hypothetical protein